MSYVVKDARKRSPYWYAVYVAPDGRRLKKSTELTARSQALEVARTLQKASDEARNRTLTEARTRELLSQVLESVQPEGLRIFTVKTWFDHFVKQKKKAKSEKTAARYEQMMDEFIEFLGHRADLNVAAINSKDVSDFRDYREGQGLAPTTVNLDITILSSAFNSARRQGHINVNPCTAVEPLKDNAQRKGTFTPEQVAALILAADENWKGVILTAFYTGQRLNDVCNLRWRDIDLVSEIKTILFRPRKTGGEVVAAMHPTLEDYLLSLPAAKSDDAYLFPALAGRKASPLSKAFRQLMEQARIEQRVIRQRGKSGRSVNALSFHSLRHSFSSILANAGVSEERRMALTGHTTRDMHQQYTHHDLAALRDAVGLLPPISTGPRQ